MNLLRTLYADRLVYGLLLAVVVTIAGLTLLAYQLGALHSTPTAIGAAATVGGAATARAIYARSQYELLDPEEPEA